MIAPPHLSLMAGGNAVASYTYDAYGAIRSQSGSSANYWGFTGEQRDAESGFTYLRERYYDPATGRFLSQDPLVGRLSAPLTQNRYIYSLNNPLNFTDPTGLSTDAVGAKSTCDHLVGAIPIGCGGGGGGGKGVAVGLGLAGAGFLAGGILVLSDNDTGAPEDANAVEGPEVPAPEPAQETGYQPTVTFGHGARHLEDKGLPQEQVEQAIRNDIAQRGPDGIPEGGFERGSQPRVVVDGIEIEYHPFPLPDGTIHVGTYFVPTP